MHGSLARAPSESRIGFYPSEESRLDEGVQVPPAPRSRWHHVHPTVEPVHPDPSEHRRDVLKSLVLAPLLPNSLGLVRNERIPLPTSKEQAQGDLGEDAYPPPPKQRQLRTGGPRAATRCRRDRAKSRGSWLMR